MFEHVRAGPARKATAVLRRMLDQGGVQPPLEGRVTNPLPPNPYVRLLPREAVCDGCGKMYMQTTSTQLYCGDPCGEFVGAECATCGQPFDARGRDCARGWGRFCSKSCAMSKKRAA